MTKCLIPLHHLHDYHHQTQLHHVADLLGDVGHFQVYLLLQHHLSGHYYHQL